ncbi:MAG: hypothetical protein ACR2HY_03485 [Acidimicrobiales bacterium]
MRSTLFRPARVIAALVVLTAAAAASGNAGATTSAAVSGSPVIRSVRVVGTVANPTFIVTGSGFDSRPAPDPSTSPSGQQGCPATPVARSGFLYGTNLFVADLNARAGGFAGQQWDAGISSPGGEGEFDCVGLVIRAWSDHVVIFRYGNLYDQNVPDNNYVLSNGDPIQVGVKGATSTTTVRGLVDTTHRRPTTTTTAPSSTSTTTTAPSSTSTTSTSTTSTSTTIPSGTPVITSVTTTGTVANPTITVRGSGFGAEPLPSPATPPSGQQGCPVTTDAGSGHLYGENLFISDTAAQRGNQSNWTAGESNQGTFDCVGLVILSWSDTQVTFTFGDLYNKNLPENYYVLTNGDPITVNVKGAVFNTSVSGLS